MFNPTIDENWLLDEMELEVDGFISAGGIRCLSNAQRGRTLEILEMGVSRRTAVKYAKCLQEAFDLEMQHDEAFTEAVAEAEARAELFFLQKIRHAAANEEQAKAEAWAAMRKH